MGKICGDEGWISLGPWGGEYGEDWAYKAVGPIMQITIGYNIIIESILFERKCCDGVVVGSFGIGCNSIGGTTRTDEINDEGLISLGPWGGKDGVDWAYKANGPIMQISICYGEAINSILFRCRSFDGLVIGSSEKIGGTGGHTTKTTKNVVNKDNSVHEDINLEGLEVKLHAAPPRQGQPQANNKLSFPSSAVVSSKLRE
ncbi:hypothetical protein RHSIM_Rhsim12G0044900 [Rhododendron simsii]|uniref:Jacalin-type lectin domain-containing protein n=1 Tax=Rhododendron simsii TaxID=118357 RepID=A0A834G3H5_RHOSS|nr:hypothetical protein RHSIM_Rhsim12G0044900 [Rhododendron simsii]